MGVPWYSLAEAEVKASPVKKAPAKAEVKVAPAKKSKFKPEVFLDEPKGKKTAVKLEPEKKTAAADKPKSRRSESN